LFQDNGTLYAVYDFLERACGVRWYVPGAAGMVVPRRPTLTVPVMHVRRAPAMLYRWITPTALYLANGADAVPPREVDLWRLRMRLGGQQYQASHSLYGYYDRFLKMHAGWFAQGHTGQPPQMCYTNPEFIAQVVKDARNFFDARAPRPPRSHGRLLCARADGQHVVVQVPAVPGGAEPRRGRQPQFNNGRASNYIWAS